MAATITGIVFDDSNHNGQYDSTDPPIAGVTVVLMNPFLECTFSKTDANGVYTFTVATTGDYTVFEPVTDDTKNCPPSTFTQPLGYTMSNGPRKLSVTVTQAQIDENITINNLNFSHIQLDNPLSCTSCIIQFSGKPTSWYNIDVTTGKSNLQAPLNPSSNVNAIGYLILDNYLYGYNQSTNNIVRIDNCGDLNTLFPNPSGLPLKNYNAATFDNTGFFYLFVSGESIFYTVDLRPNSSTYLKLVDPLKGYSEQTVDFGTALSKEINICDWIFLNGYLYGIDRQGDVHRVTPATRDVISLSTKATKPHDYFGSIAVDSNGNIFAIANSGEIYKYNIRGEHACGKIIGRTQANNFTDGTMCQVTAVNLDCPGKENIQNAFLSQSCQSQGLLADIAVYKSVSPKTVIAGSKITYEIRVANNGPDPAEKPILSDELPPEIENAEYCIDGVCNWHPFDGNLTLPTILQGGLLLIYIRGNVKDSFQGNLSNTVAVVSKTFDPDIANNTSSVTSSVIQSADLAIEKMASPRNATAGEILTYTIIITNKGPSNAQNLIITDAPLNGLSNIQFSDDDGNTWSSWTGQYVLNSLRHNKSFTLLLRGTIDGNRTDPIINTVSVTSNTPDPVLCNNTSTIITPIHSGADLSILKFSNTDTVTSLDDLQYTMIVSNAGPADALNVILTDPLSDEIINGEFSTDLGVTWNSWNGEYTIGTILAGSAVTILVRGVVSTIAANNITNTATVRSSTFDPNVNNNQSTSVVSVTPRADLIITKTASPDIVMAGNQLTYTLTISNLGPSNANVVDIIDTISNVLTDPEFSIDGGINYSPWDGSYQLELLASQTIEILYIRGTVNANAVGDILNTAMVKSSIFDPNLSNNVDSIITPINSSANLSITKTSGPTPVSVNGTLTYTIQINNSGPNNALNVRLEDTIPASLSNVQFSIDSGTTWNTWVSPYTIGMIPSQAFVTILIRGVVGPDASGNIMNTATVRSDTPDPDLSNNSATSLSPVGTAADLTVEKSVITSPAISGNTLEYRVLVTNFGPNDAQNTFLTDAVTNSLINPEYSIDNGVTWNSWVGSLNLGTVATGASRTILLRAVINPSFGGPLDNSAVISSTTPDPFPLNNSSSTETDVAMLADISITKSSLPNPVIPKEELTYTLTLLNAGPSNAQNVLLIDAVPAEITNPVYSTDGGLTFHSWVNPLHIGSLTVNTSTEILIKGTMNASIKNQIKNTAVVYSSTPDPNLTNNSAVITTNVSPSADLMIEKIAMPNLFIAGQEGTYTIIITNKGPSNAENVVLTDTLPTAFKDAAVSIDCGATWQPWTGNYVIGTLGSNTVMKFIIRGTIQTSATGNITNTASVSSTTTDPNPDNNSQTIITSVANFADVAVSKTINQSSARIGETFIYTIKINNYGPSNAENVVLFDDVPQELDNVQYSIDDGIHWNPWVSPFSIGNMGKDVTTKVLIKGTVRTLDVRCISNTCTVTSTTPDPNSENNKSTVAIPVNNSPDVRILKMVSQETVLPSEELTYTIVLSNDSLVDAGNICVIDHLPDVLLDAVYSDDDGYTWFPWSGSYQRNTLKCGEEIAILIKGIVSPYALGTITNTAYIDGNTQYPKPSNQCFTTVTDIISAADLTIKKEGSIEYVLAGNKLNYTLTVRNQGPSTAVNVIVTDQIPSVIADVEYSIDDGKTWNRWNGSVSFESLECGENRVVLITGNAPSSSTVDIDSVASVTSSTFDPNTENNSDTASISLNHSADISVVSFASPNPAITGQLLTYTHLITNYGPSTAENIVLANNINSAEYSIDNGATWCTWNGSQELGALLLGQTIIVLIKTILNDSCNNSIENTATVTSTTPDLNEDNNTVTIVTPINDIADICIDMQPAQCNARQGEFFTYMIQVKNMGPGIARNVVITDTPPIGVSEMCYSLNDTNCWEEWNGFFYIDSLEKNSTFNLLLRARIDNDFAGVLENKATVKADSVDTNECNNCSTVSVNVFSNGCRNHNNNRFL